MDKAYNSASVNGEVNIEIALLDENNDPSKTGELYDYTNEQYLQYPLTKLAPYLRRSQDFYGVLVIEFTAELYYDRGDHYTPAESGDERSITRVYLIIYSQDNPKGQKIFPPFMDNMRRAIEKTFIRNVEEAEIEVESERDRYDESKIRLIDNIAEGLTDI